MRLVAIAAVLLAVLLATETGQRLAFPDAYRIRQADLLKDALAVERAHARDLQDRLGELRERATQTPEDAEVYLTMQRQLEADIAAISEQADWLQSRLDRLRGDWQTIR